MIIIIKEIGGFGKYFGFVNSTAAGALGIFKVNEVLPEILTKVVFGFRVTLHIYCLTLIKAAYIVNVFYAFRF